MKKLLLLTPLILIGLMISRILISHESINSVALDIGLISSGYISQSLLVG